MQKKAWTICGCTAFCGALGIFLRWLQTMTNYDADTGLYLRGTATDWVVALFSVITAAVLLVLVLRWVPGVKKDMPAPAMRTHNLFFLLVAGAAGLLMLAGGAAMFFGAGKSAVPGLIRILALLVVVTGLAIPGMAMGTNRDTPTPFQALCAVVPVLFCCYWLIVEYKLYAENPEVWIYAFDILAVAASTLSFYFIAGYFLGRPKPRNAVYFSQLAVFFCLVSLMDSSETGHAPVLAAAALIQFAFSWVLINNQTAKKG